jgi:hypothetical protein
MNVRLVTYRPALVDSGIQINNGSGYPVSTSATTITVDGANAETVLDEYASAGRGVLVDISGNVYGLIKSVASSTSIILYTVETALSDEDRLYYYPVQGYELELQEAPNISINYQFSDIKEPETRKGSYTQTFKLPFTDANNEFFQNWYNVNLATLVFNTHTKFSAVLFVGTVPQFEGFIQLKAVYQKAKYYEVVLMSNTTDLFSVIGEKKLKEVFKNSDGTYSDELNHLYNYSNIKLSWDGDNPAFVNTSGATLQDSTVDVQKVMYPLSITKPNFFYKTGSNKYLDMTDADIAAYVAGTGAWGTQSGYSSAANFMVDINQLRPAIQLKTLFKLIFARAGFSYASEFIDGDYFGKLYMTTGNKLPTSSLPTAQTEGVLPGGYVFAKQETPGQRWFYQDNYAFGSICSNAVNPPELFWECNVDVEDESSVWNTSTDTLTKISDTMNWVQFQSVAFARNCKVAGTSSNNIPIQLVTVAANNTNFEYSSTTIYVQSDYNGDATDFQVYADLSDVNVGDSVKFKLVAPAMCLISPVDLGSYPPTLGVQGFGVVEPTSRLKSDWLPYNPTQYNQEVLVPQCIDDTITQKAFLKDIIERFNLVLIADPDNASNIIIEPYDDYLAQSSIKDWSEKLDISKEVVVKDTTALQKSIINLTDLEDVDMMNKSIAEVAPSLNVYGHYFNNRINNDFATGEFKNNPIFSPYINQQVFRDASTSQPSQLRNVIVQYEISYENTDDGTEPALEETKPKLFYYFGKQTDIIGAWSDLSIYLHERNATTGVISAKEFDQYPVCSPYDINTSAESPTDEYTLVPTNRSLLWNFAPPQCGDIVVFNYTSGDPSWQKNSLYFRYWRQYLDGIYGGGSRIMEAYFNLDEVDIFNFKFNDEIFVKDSYWRIINIHNYQVGEKASTKVTLLKAVSSISDSNFTAATTTIYEEEYDNNCNYVIGGTQADGFEPGGPYYWFCPDTDPDCTMDYSNDDQWIIPEECCIELGGEPDYSASGLWGFCLANGGSPPVSLYQLDLPITLTGQVGLKSFMQGKLGNLNLPLSSGANRGKFTQPLLPRFGDDIMIKYKTLLAIKPQVDGESHRMVLLGNTDGNTRGYAYPENVSNADAFTLPTDANVMIQVKGIATVIGGTSSNYVVGVTESFSYHTAFRVMGGFCTQIGNAGGVVEWSLKDPTLSTTATLYIAQNTTTGGIDFGLDDSQTDTKRAWTLVVDFTVQNVENLRLPFDTDWALYQNGNAIELMNYDYLIWN